MSLKGVYRAQKIIRDREELLSQTVGNSNRSGEFPTTQPGPQTAFYQTEADIAIYGGAAGGGKSAACLIDAIRFIEKVPNYNCVFFRRTFPEIFNPGALFDESQRWYPLLGGEANLVKARWIFPKNEKIQFAHLQHEKTLTQWHGSQIARLYFDELCTFTEKQFWYLLSRCRTILPIKPQVRATCNPDSESWVADLLEWWIGDDGLPIKEKSGVLRWFIRVNNNLVWGDSKEELGLQYPAIPPKSLTFIPASIYDNKILLENDPDYLANLYALHEIDRQRLLLGNWKIKPEAGVVFNRTWFEMIDEIDPDHINRIVRFWDLAATKTQLSYYTAGVKMAILKDKTIVVLDAIWDRTTPVEAIGLIRKTAEQDGRLVTVGWEQEPGSAGIMVMEQIKTCLKGFRCKPTRPHGDKIQRALPYATSAQNGRVFLLRGTWNDQYINALHHFDGSGKPLINDLTDASSGAFDIINSIKSTWIGVSGKDI
jgi:predicted phage terminase large subunit-like protein